MTLLEAYLKLVLHYEMQNPDRPYKASHVPEKDDAVYTFQYILSGNMNLAQCQEVLDMIEELHGTYIFSFVGGLGETNNVGVIHLRIRENLKTIQRIEEQVYDVCE